MNASDLPVQKPLALPRAQKTETRAQFAALCFRESEDGLEICLVKGRGSGRWLIPKGWPMKGKRPAEAAAIEAWEEAGLKGDAIDQCLGVYTYTKTIGSERAPVVVMVYPLRVIEQKKQWPEKRERSRKWFPAAKAGKKVQEPTLAAIIRSFSPGMLKG